MVKVGNSFSILIVLLLILFLAPAPILLQPLTNIAFAANVTNVTRALPSGALCPNTSFNVTVNWTTTTDGVNSLLLTDFAPAGWSVSGNSSWSTPSPNMPSATGNKIEIMWIQEAANGTVFTAKYKVTVPGNATPGNYTFTNGTLGYCVNIFGPFTENVTGNTTVTVNTAPVANITTNATGYYNFTVNTTCNYTVNVTRSGLTYAEKQATITALGQNVTCDFKGLDAPYRKAPDGLYCLKCSNLWLCGGGYPQGFALDATRVSDVLYAWTHPS